MKGYNKIIFVSNSDTATGPMAEAILESKDLLYPLDANSRGLVALFPEPLNPKVEAILASNGLTMKNHMSISLSKIDLQSDYLILTMQLNQKNKILEKFKDTENVHLENVYTISEYLGCGGDIITPHGGSLAEYAQCYNALESLVEKLVIKLNED